MGQHEDERAGEDRTDIISVIARCMARQPEIHMRNHEGYYRHSDVSALIRALSDATNQNTEDTGEWSPDPTRP